MIPEMNNVTEMIDIDTVISIATMVFSFFGAILGALITSNASKRDNNVQLRQLEVIYYPAYKIINCINYEDKNISPFSAKIVVQKLLKLFEDNEIIVLHGNITRCKYIIELIDSNKPFHHSFFYLCVVVLSDYENIKKRLGYPSKRSYRYFLRLTFKDKLRFLSANYKFNLLMVALLFFLMIVGNTPNSTGNTLLFAFVVTYMSISLLTFLYTRR